MDYDAIFPYVDPLPERLTHEQQERLIKIFNEWGFFSQDRYIQDMTWDDYSYYVSLYYRLKAS